MMAKQSTPPRRDRSRQGSKSSDSSNVRPTASRRSASKTDPVSENAAQPADPTPVRKRTRRAQSAGSVPSKKDGPAGTAADPANKTPAKTATLKGVKGFQRGISGNPSGRPLGSKNKSTLIADLLQEGEREEIYRTLVDHAKDGDPTAMRLVIERLDPKPRSRPIQVELPPASTREGIIDAMDAVTQAVARGQITPDEGHALAALLLRTSVAIVAHGILERVEQMENNIERYKNVT